MRVKASISFSGKLSMYAGEIREVEDEEILMDLLSACYVEPVEITKPVKSVEPKTTKKVVKKNESKRTKK